MVYLSMVSLCPDCSSVDHCHLVSFGRWFFEQWVYLKASNPELLFQVFGSGTCQMVCTSLSMVCFDPRFGTNLEAMHSFRFYPVQLLRYYPNHGEIFSWFDAITNVEYHV